MTRMAQLDLITMRRNLVSLAVICVIVAAVMTFSMGTPLIGAGAVASLVPYMYVSNVFAYDDMVGWGRMRLTMPVSRSGVVLGRYLGVLAVAAAGAVFAAVLGVLTEMLLHVTGIAGAIDAGPLPLDNPVTASLMAAVLGCVLALVAISFVMPAFFRFGMTKGTRLVTLLFIFAVCMVTGISANYLGESASPDQLAGLLSGISIPLVYMVATGVALGLYAASAALSVRLFAGREL